MRLTKIKLAGFKSFVDPTTLVVPANLVGIVGPNGCGKSNIIDAVTWVMGESSAKHLRGDALTDVIFNGSSTRNPVGQASVEIIFDNSEKKLGGEYASYDEISIKRQINRDAISTYYLNGARCRRRDIQSIFLGTGLGPRSYAIIEQGMISRLIEARPEDLRSFIEEAAGISKYRERRRETENRIRNARDNIARLNDIREELDKQLKHLQRQAKAAEKYHELKNEQRRLEAELQALHWRERQVKFARQEEETSNQVNLVEAAVADLRKVEAVIAGERETTAAANNELGIAQSAFYQVGGEISQMEQKIQHLNEKITAAGRDLEQLAQENRNLALQQEQDQARLEKLRAARTDLTHRLETARTGSDQAYRRLNEAEQDMQAWQNDWEACTVAVAEHQRQLEVAKTRLDHLEQALEDHGQRQRILQKELSAMDKPATRSAPAALKKTLGKEEREVAALTAELEEKRRDWHNARAQTRSLSEKAHAARQHQQHLSGRLETLEALQKSTLGLDHEKTRAWLKSAQLLDRPRLSEHMQVEPEWTHAVDIVLGHFLHSICVKNLDAATRKLDQLDTGQIGMVDTGRQATVRDHHQRPVLAGVVSASFPLRHLLDDVYLADSLTEAQALRATLSGRESVITRDGIWLGVNWARITRGVDGSQGMLARTRETEKLKDEISRSAAALKQMEQAISAAGNAEEEAEKKLEQVQSRLQERLSVLSMHRAELSAAEGQELQAGNRKTRITEEIEQLLAQTEEDQGEIESLHNECSRMDKVLATLCAQRDQLEGLRDRHRGALIGARDSWQQAHEQSHDIALQLESNSSQCAGHEQSVKHGVQRLAQIQQRRAELEKLLAESLTLIDALKTGLESKLHERVEAEKALTNARTAVQQVETRLRELEQSRAQLELRIRKLRDDLEQARLQTQESSVWLQSIEEKLRESGHELKEVLAELAADAAEDAWRERLDQVNQKIQRLGPINLAAIEEFGQLSERKTYLDRQDQDLNEALQTLEDAIRKIDKESRTRFKETFDQLNANLQALFPQLFGGGHAYLELTGDNLLETGVTVMARPPGKRNSTIHLLSGGEKALTAVALVFSIFKLNPAPFCILDEVDAPLDDANVGRFSELVTGMSEDVQFIFVTHNKITMEIAHQLLGVTMHEAGVSRLVSVDVDEAVKLAATA